MEERYLLSFTALGLGLSPSLVVAEAYVKSQDWEITQTRIKAENLLQSRVTSSSNRVYREVEPRLQTLSEAQLRFLVEEANLNEQKQIIWYAICKRYGFIRDFATEVLYQRHQLLHTHLEEYDYTVFYNEKADWHDELRDLKESTQIKLRTVLFRMLREADFLTKDFRIVPCFLSQAVVNQLAVDASWSLKIYPANTNISLGGNDAV